MFLFNIIHQVHAPLSQLQIERESKKSGKQIPLKQTNPNKYLRREFHVSHLRGMRRDEGFKNPGPGSLLWWSPAVGPDDIKTILESQT